MMPVFQVVLMLTAFLCSLVAGFLFAFAVVVMPGIGRLNDREFIRSFQVIDRVIQRGQPVFLLVWVGSVLTLIAAALLSLWMLDGANRLFVIAAAFVYLLCVQLPTVAINIPLNNALQTLNPDTMDEATRTRARNDFEPRWNRWNARRTVCAGVASVLLLLVLLRL
jgi:uncharacterized membrane protein